MTTIPTIQADLRGMNLSELAGVILEDWDRPNYAAVPYLDALRTLDTIDDPFYEDSGASIVRYFLGNARAWRGDTARLVKAELRRRINL